MQGSAVIASPVLDGSWIRKAKLFFSVDHFSGFLKNPQKDYNDNNDGKKETRLGFVT